MTDGAKIFGMKGNEAVALYSAGVTVLAMMADENYQGKARDDLEAGCERWFKFCESRGVEVPGVTEAMAQMRRTRELKVL